LTPRKTGIATTVPIRAAPGGSWEVAMRYVLISAGLIGLYFALARTGNTTAAAVLTIGGGVVATVILGLMKDA
jgi:hypothetical protein